MCIQSWNVVIIHTNQDQSHNIPPSKQIETEEKNLLSSRALVFYVHI